MHGYPTLWQATLAVLAWVPFVILGVLLLTAVILSLSALISRGGEAREDDAGEGADGDSLPAFKEK